VSGFQLVPKGYGRGEVFRIAILMEVRLATAEDTAVRCTPITVRRGRERMKVMLEKRRMLTQKVIACLALLLG